MAQRASKLRDVVRLVRAGIKRQKPFQSIAFKERHIPQNGPPNCASRCNGSIRDSSSSSLQRSAAAPESQLRSVNSTKKTSSVVPTRYSACDDFGQTIHRFRPVMPPGSCSARAEESLVVGEQALGRCGYRSVAHTSGLRHSINSGYRSSASRAFSNMVIKKEATPLSVKRGSAEFAAGRRAYHLDNQGMQHFRRRGPAAWTERFVSQRSAGMILVLAGGGLVVYYTNLQTVPYTHRKHFVLISPGMERSVGDRTYESIMQEYKNKLLSPTHPQSIRVGRIADQIIESVMQGVGASDWGKVEHGAHDVLTFPKDWDNRGAFRNGELRSDNDRSSLESDAGLLGQVQHNHVHDDSPVMDEGWVDRSRQEGLEAGREGYTKHLEGMKWKVVVVDDEIVNAVCIPGGKIVVFTGLLKKFRSDAEVATVVAHEVGHAVARHSAEALTNNLFIVALQLVVLSVFYVPGLVNSVSELLLRLPFSRRMEMEADHIGLILMAAAGYDPRLAPGFYEKLGKLDKSPEYAQYMSTHPSGKKRGDLLRKTATMEEALQIYQRKMSGQGTEGFF